MEDQAGYHSVEDHSSMSFQNKKATKKLIEITIKAAGFSFAMVNTHALHKSLTNKTTVYVHRPVVSHNS